MNYKEKVKKFFSDAEENGYDHKKIRRRIEHEMRELQNNNLEKFEEASYAMLKSLGIQLRKKNEHL